MALPSTEIWRESLTLEHVGYAAGVTGGKGGTWRQVTNTNDSGAGSLREACETAGAAWITFTGSAFAGAATITLATVISITSNKTIDGRGRNVTLATSGIEVGTWDHGVTGPVTNVIIENIKFKNTTSNGQLIIAENASDVWVDHCTFQDAVDEEIYVGSGSSLMGTHIAPLRVTISWCYFPAATNLTTFANKALLVSDPSDTVDAATTITSHHNYFETGVRNPLARWATIHAFNNYYKRNEICIQMRHHSKLLAENEIFEAPYAGAYPRVKVDAYAPGGELAADSVKVVNPFLVTGTETYEQINTSSIFTPSYTYRLETANSILQAKIVGSGKNGAGWQVVTTGGPTNPVDMGWPSSSIYDNSAGTFRETNSAVLVYGGGGASSWCGNEVRSLCLEEDNPTWKTLNKPMRQAEIWLKSEEAAVLSSNTRSLQMGYGKRFADGITPEAGYEQPMPRHTYWAVHHDTVRDQVITTKATAIAPSDLGQVGAIDSLPLTGINWTTPALTYGTIKWDSPFTPNGSGGYTTTRRHPPITYSLYTIHAQCKDPTTQRIYIANGNVGGDGAAVPGAGTEVHTTLMYHDPATNTNVRFYNGWVAGDPGPTPGHFHRPAVLSVNTTTNQLLVFFADAAPPPPAGVAPGPPGTTAYVWNLSTHTRTTNATIYDTVGGALTSKLGIWYDSADGRGIVYDRGTNKFVCVIDENGSGDANGNTKFYTFTRDGSGNYLMEQMTLAAGPLPNKGAPAKASYWGGGGARPSIFGLLSYCPNLKGIVYNPSPLEKAYFIRTS